MNDKKMGCFYIISLKYGFAHWQHMKSFALKMTEKGCPTRFVLSKGFQRVNKEFTDSVDYLTISGLSLLSTFLDVGYIILNFFRFVRTFKKNIPSGALLASWHPMNPFVVKIIKMVAPDCPIYWWMHEPYKEDKSAYSWKKIQITIMEYLQERLLPLIDTVVVHSKRGYNAFKKRYPEYKGGVKIIPLGFADESKTDTHPLRSYDITFVGGAVRAKGIDGFFRLVEKNMELNSDLTFCIVTSTNIDKYLARLKPNWEKRLVVINHKHLTDEEIRVACAKSYAIIAPYIETTQSGAIPVAFMNGTPAIGTDIKGLHEYIKEKRNGVYIPVNYSYKDVVAALEYIKANFGEMSGNARKSFETIWSDSNWDRYYGWIFETGNWCPKKTN